MFNRSCAWKSVGLRLHSSCEILQVSFPVYTLFRLCFQIRSNIFCNKIQLIHSGYYREFFRLPLFFISFFGRSELRQGQEQKCWDFYECRILEGCFLRHFIWIQRRLGERRQAQDSVQRLRRYLCGYQIERSGEL